MNKYQIWYIRMMLISRYSFVAGLVLFAATVASAQTIVDSQTLGSTDADGEPNLPKIDGAFDVEFKVRFESIDSQYQNLFEYCIPNLEAQILLQNHDTTLFQVSVGTKELICRSHQVAASAGNVHHYQFDVDRYGFSYISRDGKRLAECNGMHLPLDVDRNKYLGNGPYASRAPSASCGPLRGAILGVQVLHYGILNSLPGKYEFLNLPGQSFEHAFEVTFFARFDSLYDRKSQRVFEFGNTEGADMIWCGQVEDTNSMECGMAEDGNEYYVTAAGAIDPGTFASWKFTVDSDGAFRILKNGQQLDAKRTIIMRKHVVRRKQQFGASSFDASILRGSVVANRLQPLTDGS